PSATLERYPLSLHDALPISEDRLRGDLRLLDPPVPHRDRPDPPGRRCRARRLRTLRERRCDTLPRANVEPLRGRRGDRRPGPALDRKSTRLNSSHVSISYAV